MSPDRRPEAVLTVEDLSVEYAGPRAATRAVRDVTFDVRRGEVLGIVGESGCGKSTLAYALGRMLRPPARMTSGRITFHGRDGDTLDLTALAGEALRAFRWERLSMVFQSAMNSLNPVTSIGKQFGDILRTHRPEMDAAARRSRSGDLLEMVGIDRVRLRSFPHELSGGMRQRVSIAMALALAPEVVIMDEPTTALDVVVQREILDEVYRLREELGFAVVFITHDLSLLLEISDRIAVMYAGRIVEIGASDAIAQEPAHPYAVGLLRSFPDLRGDRPDLRGVPGSPPDLRGALPGCAFAPRCEHAFGPCADVLPQLRPAPYGRAGTVACHLHDPAYAAASLPRERAASSQATGAGQPTGAGGSMGSTGDGTSGGRLR